MFSRFVALILLFLLIRSPIQATVVINEFLPNPSGPQSEDTEWIELYNIGPDSVDLAGWQLDDFDGGSSPYVIASGSSIPASAYLVFEKSTTNIALNNSDDTVRLLNAQSSVVDSHGYGSTSEDVSIGRTSNGGGSWVSCNSPTKGSSNNCSEPTQTPTNTPANSPTNVPQTTNTPTLGPTATPGPSKKPTPIKTPTPRISPSPTATVAAVLGTETAIASATATASGGLQQALPLIIALMLVAMGLAILAGVLVWKKRRKMDGQ